jgi:hypothetical protein
VRGFSEPMVGNPPDRPALCHHWDSAIMLDFPCGERLIYQFDDRDAQPLWVSNLLADIRDHAAACDTCEVPL